MSFSPMMEHDGLAVRDERTFVDLLNASNLPAGTKYSITWTEMGQGRRNGKLLFTTGVTLSPVNAKQRLKLRAWLSSSVCVSVQFQ